MAKKKLIMLTPNWTGMNEFLIDNEFRGMPAFFRFLNKAAETYDVYLFIMGNYPKSKLRHNFKIQKLNILGLLKILLLSFDKNAVLLCHGVKPIIYFLFLKMFYRFKFQRLYGSNKYYSEALKKGKRNFFLRYPLVALTYSCRADGKILTDDGSNSDRLVKLFNPEQSIRFRRNGIVSEISSYLPEERTWDGLRIICAGRISPKKQQHLFVEISRALKMYSDIEFILVGSVSDKDYFNSFGAKLLSKNTTYYGSLEQDKLHELMKKSDIFLSVQRGSNFSNTLVEAIQNNCLIITFNDSTISEVFQNGELLVCRDIAEIVKTIKELYVSLDFSRTQHAKDTLALHLQDWTAVLLDDIKYIEGHVE